MEWLLAVGALLLLAVAALAAAGLYGAEQLTRPKRVDIEDSAARWGLPEPERVRCVARDGLRLAGWWFPAPGAPRSIVVCHGHGGSKATNLWLAAALHPHFGVLLLDARGHGDSEGDRTSVGYLERLDIIAAVDWLLDRFGPHPIGLLGISMGAAASILAAADCPAVSAVVADSAFARLRTPLRVAIGARGYPRIAVPVLAWAVHRIAAWRLGALRGPWLDPLDVVGRISPRPLLLIHGQADEMIPVSEAELLLRAAGEPKQAWILPEVGHACAAEVEPRLYGERIHAFFEAALHRADEDRRAPVRALEPEREAGLA